MRALQCPYCDIVYSEEDGHDPEECYKLCLAELKYYTGLMEDALKKVLGSARILSEKGG